MALNSARARQLLAKCDLKSLFIEELGWDRHGSTLKVTPDGQSITLQAVAQKRGMVSYHCVTPEGQRLPDYALRRKLSTRLPRRRMNI